MLRTATVIPTKTTTETLLEHLSATVNAALESKLIERSKEFRRIGAETPKTQQEHPYDNKITQIEIKYASGSNKNKLYVYTDIYIYIQYICICTNIQ